MRLNIGIFGIEQLFQPFNCDELSLVNNLATAVIPVARVTLCILVGHYRAHGLQHLRADKIFRGNELEAVDLALPFLFNKIKNRCIPVHFLYFDVFLPSSGWPGGAQPVRYSAGKYSAYTTDMIPVLIFPIPP